MVKKKERKKRRKVKRENINKCESTAVFRTKEFKKYRPATLYGVFYCAYSILVTLKR